MNRQGQRWLRGACIAAAVVALGAAPVWEQQSPSAAPPPRWGHGLAFDSARGRTVLFGGYDSTTDLDLGDTWEWDGAVWRQVVPAGDSPAARHAFALAYDEARGRTVLHAGFESYGGVASRYFSDTWLWDGVSWTKADDGGLGPRCFHAMAYDSGRGRLVLFGGQGANNELFDDTWEWDGTSWTLRLTGGPSACRDHGMAYDAVRGRTVMIGGEWYLRLFCCDDVWEWDGSSWAEIADLHPYGDEAMRPVMAFDDLLGRTVALVGYTYLWDGAEWQQAVALGPGFELKGAVAYDRWRGRVVGFGRGLSHGSETWELLVPTTPCFSAAACSSGHCVDGVCCASACTAPCWSCGLPHSAGVCAPVPAGTFDPACGGTPCNGSGACLAPPGSSCQHGAECLSGFCEDGVCCDRACAGQCEACDLPGSAGRCAYSSAGAVCAPAGCLNGVATTESTCDGAGTCAPGAATDCGDYGCGPTTCNTSCTIDAECAPGRICVAGGCVVQPDGGSAADAASSPDGGGDAEPRQPDGARSSDGARTSDGGEGLIRPRGCDCRAAGVPRPPSWLLLILCLAPWRTRRRRPGDARIRR